MQEHRLNLSFLPLNQPYLLSSLGIFLLGALEGFGRDCDVKHLWSL